MRLAPLRTSVWRNRDFARLWTASAISQTGSQVTLLALPFVAITTLSATTFEVAALGVADFAPLILFALPAGVWVDRMRRRPIMIVSDVARAVALASIPVAYALGLLTIWQLFAVGFVTGTLTVFFDVASQSFLPSVVQREMLADGNASLQIGAQGAQLAGPGIGGTIISILGAPYAVIADAASFVASAGFITGIKSSEVAAPLATRQRMTSEIREGLRYVLRHPILRPTMAFTATANVFNSILFSVFLLFAVRTLGLSAKQVGLVLTVANIGALLGAALLTRLQRRLGIGRAMIVAAFSGWSLLLIPIASGSYRIPLLMVAFLCWGTGVMIYNASSVTILQATTPDRLMARMNASRRLVVWGTVPLATLLGGLLGTYVGLRTTVFIGAAGRAVAGLIIFASPVRSIRTLDDADGILKALNISSDNTEFTAQQIQTLEH